ncbi:hypothetical protein GDO81_009463 [Engystomops pustulosus]|uniref:Uncharacterized protein n=1 Tax=Engystomops pustulosus TaxID=76066 RepID=A0AAV7BS52_ENGPU|nr:hypothetical protein GDO81_009463 [Engystomops pustulosus]
MVHYTWWNQSAWGIYQGNRHSSFRAQYLQLVMTMDNTFRHISLFYSYLKKD